MNAEQADELDALAAACLRRWFHANGFPAPAEEEVAGVCARLRSVIAERGLPRVPPGGRPEEAVEMPAAECGPLERRVLGERVADPCWGTPVRQLVKACLQPEFRRCRDSYRERSPDGSCRRQDPEKAAGRLSGSPCVDCPYWLELTPAQHERALREAWAGDPAVLAARPEVFLPADFRELRRCVRRLAGG